MSLVLNIDARNVHLTKLAGAGDRGIKKGERPCRRTLTNLSGDNKHLREASQSFIGKMLLEVEN